jgi:hypothetical protein
MTIVSWCRSLLHGWRMFQAHTRSRRSLRAIQTALGLPVHRMSVDEIDASVVNFALLARVNGLSPEDVAVAVRDIRATVAA